ncbi:response regulator transcription factor [Promicromonospora sp. NPDC023987]|uniref:response regulator transcription factor n=1 Tax=Promicromonospora sp. NPDC023987 TaxID=3155360 RepID=UPI0033C32BAD
MDLDARRVLLVEDDKRLSELLVRLLTAESYEVVSVFDGQAGLHHGLTGRWDALVIDRTLPALEGVELVRRLRSRGITTPMMLLTARGTTEDRVEGLDSGAEDYVVKPFDSDELLARLRALLRRHTDTSPMIDLGGRRLDVASRRVLSPGAEPVELSAQECALLRVIAANPGRVRSREELHRRVFQNADSPNAVDTYVYYLRRKLGHGMIRTVRGLGYRLGPS